MELENVGERSREKKKEKQRRRKRVLIGTKKKIRLVEEREDDA